MSNPLARARRLGAALRDLRAQRGWKHTDLAAASGVSASVISRMENPLSDIGRRPDLVSVRAMLDALGVSRKSDTFRRIDGYAETAGVTGWWYSVAHTRMGTDQRSYAIVEAGAGRIDEYGGQLIPGLAQTEAYARHRVAVDVQAVEVDAIVAGRMERQRRVREASTAYRLVLEEQAIRRWPAPAAVMVEQLEHLLNLAGQPDISIRIVPVGASLGEGAVPRAPFAHLSYPDPDDPQIVIVDNEQPLLVVDRIEAYARLHQRLRGAALSDADSASLIREMVKSPATV